MSKVYLLIAALVVVFGCTRKSKDRNMIFEAIESGDTVRVQQYLARGAANNIRKDYCEVPPLEIRTATSLHLAAITGNKKLVDLLLTNAANMNAKTESGQPPLDATNIDAPIDEAREFNKIGKELKQQDYAHSLELMPYSVCCCKQDRQKFFSVRTRKTDTKMTPIGFFHGLDESLNMYELHNFS